MQGELRLNSKGGGVNESLNLMGQFNRLGTTRIDAVSDCLYTEGKGFKIAILTLERVKLGMKGCGVRGGKKLLEDKSPKIIIRLIRGPNGIDKGITRRTKGHKKP